MIIQTYIIQNNASFVSVACFRRYVNNEPKCCSFF